MRITSSMVNDNVLANIQRNMQNLALYQNQLSSGKKFSTMAEDPIGASTTLRLNKDLSTNKQYVSNLDEVKPFLDVADANLTDITNAISQIKVLAQQGMNGSQDSQSQQVIADSMSSMITAMINSGNANYNGRYIFGGYNTVSPPFVISGDTVRFNGTTDTINAAVGKNEMLQGSVSGNSLFVTHNVLGDTPVYSKTATIFPVPDTNQFSIKVGTQDAVIVAVNPATGYSLSDVAEAINHSGADVTAKVVQESGYYKLELNSHIVGEAGTMTLEDLGVAVNKMGILETLGIVNHSGGIIGAHSDPQAGVIDSMLRMKNAMASGDITTVSTELEKLDKGYQNSLVLHGRIGQLAQQAEIKKTILQKGQDSITELLSTTQDIDYAEVSMKLNQEQTAYQAALQVGAKLVKTTLLDYL